MKKTSKHLLTFALLALFCVMSQAASAAEGWDEALYKQIESRIVAPTFKNKTYNIKKFGASEKATAAKNQQAIIKAIEKCSQKGGGTVVVSGTERYPGAGHCAVTAVPGVRCPHVPGSGLAAGSRLLSCR